MSAGLCTDEKKPNAVQSGATLVCWVCVLTVDSLLKMPGFCRKRKRDGHCRQKTAMHNEKDTFCLIVFHLQTIVGIKCAVGVLILP